MSLDKADQQEEEQKAAPAPAPKSGDEEGAKEGTVAERLLDKIIMKFGAEPAGIARGVLELSPSERDQVMRVVHARFGNSFVAEVEREIGLMSQAAHDQASMPPPQVAAPEEEAAEPPKHAEEVAS